LDDTRRKCGFFILADLNGHEGEQENTSEHEKNDDPGAFPRVLGATPLEGQKKTDDGR
jgi:hypothetical protein